VLAVLCEIHQLPRRILLVDTFTGTPATSSFDLSRSPGEFVPPADQVLRIKQQAAVLGVSEWIEIHQGLFSQVFPKLQERDLRFAFVHIDANLYEGTRQACEFTLPRLRLGGIAVFDDYNGVCDLGARLAIDRVLTNFGLRAAPLAGPSAYVRAQPARSGRMR